MDTGERSVPTRSELVYDGFISYSHAADGLLAPASNPPCSASPNPGGNRVDGAAVEAWELLLRR